MKRLLNIVAIAAIITMSGCSDNSMTENQKVQLEKQAKQMGYTQLVQNYSLSLLNDEPEKALIFGKLLGEKRTAQIQKQVQITVSAFETAISNEDKNTLSQLYQAAQFQKAFFNKWKRYNEDYLPKIQKILNLKKGAK